LVAALVATTLHPKSTAFSPCYNNISIVFSIKAASLPLQASSAGVLFDNLINESSFCSGARETSGTEIASIYALVALFRMFRQKFA
jgi:hypothetical protein